MKLSDFDKVFFDVLVDGSFEMLDNVTGKCVLPHVTFAENTTLLHRACRKEGVTCIICSRELRDEAISKAGNKGIAISEKPRTAFHKLHNWLCEQEAEGYVNKWDKSKKGKDCHIDETAYICPVGVVLGNRVTVERNAIIGSGVTIGDDVVVRAGAIIGADSLLAGTDGEGNLLRLRSAGKVYIGNKTEIGLRSFVGRGMFPYESTAIGDHTLIGHAVEVEHNVQVGKNCLITGQVQICGNTVIEDNVHIAPQAVIKNRLIIGKGATIEIGAVVVNNVRSGLMVAGNFAIEHKKFLLWHKNKLRVARGGVSRVEFLPSSEKEAA